MSKDNKGDIQGTERKHKSASEPTRQKKTTLVPGKKSGDRSRKIYLSDKYSENFEARFQGISSSPCLVSGTTIVRDTYNSKNNTYKCKDTIIKTLFSEKLVAQL